MGMRDPRLDMVRLLGNLAIVGVHSYPFMYATGRNAEFWFWSCFSMDFCMMAMPMFFLVSGYLLFQNYSWGGYCKKMVSRVKRLLVPLVIWNLIACLTLLLIGLANDKAKANVIDLGLFDCKGWLKQFAVYGKLANGTLWYLRAVFVFALISPVLYLIYKCCHWILVTALCVAAVVLYPDLTRSDFPVYGFVLFALGGLAAYRRLDIVDYIERHECFFAIVSVFAVVLACCADVLRNDAAGPMPLLRFLGAPLFVVLGIFLSKLHRFSAIIKRITPASFLIYLGHGILIPCFMHSMGMAIPCCLGKMSVIAIMTMVATISVMVLTWYVMNRRCPRLLRVLDGRW